MKILILANKDVASNHALNLLLPGLDGHELHVFLSSRVGGGGDRPQALVDLATLEQHWFNQVFSPAVPPVAERGGRYRTFAQMSEVLASPLREMNAINAPEGLALLDAIAPDLVLSIRYGVILKADVLARPRLGVLNLHSGPLPAYRGVMATFHAMRRGEAAIGTTLHTIDDNAIDTGRIVTRTTLPVDPGKTYLWHVLNLYGDGCRVMLEAVRELAGRGVLVTRAQPAGGHYYTFPTAAELAEFAGRGLRLFDEGELAAFLASRFD